MMMQNLPLNLYQAAQVRELDRLAMETMDISGLELMSRAGNEVYQLICERWPDARSLSIFCGSGNNAGDGYIIAGLAMQDGLEVKVYCLSDPEQLKDDALSAYKNYAEVGGITLPFQVDQPIDADIIVDALLGTGLDRPVSGLYAEAIQTINQQASWIIAVDIPSGLHSDTGSVMGCAIKADCTVTFIAMKQGLLTGLSPEYCGEIFYASLEVPDSIIDSIEASATRVTKISWSRRKRCAHKGDYGHVLIVGGVLGYSGAVRLAGEAALRVGSGLVSLATHWGHASLMNLGRPELMCHGLEKAKDLEKLLEKASVIVLGPGLGQNDWAKEMFSVAIDSQKKMVIDADGLNLLALSPQKNANWILTPHPGEAARLLNCTTADIQEDRFASAAAIQAKYGGVTVLKGAGTLIASEEEMAVSTTGNPGMASGGMGDVLAGVIAGLLAQGFSLQNAAQQGAFGHGYAADCAAKENGERGLLASDLMPYLRQWINE